MRKKANHVFSHSGFNANNENSSTSVRELTLIGNLIVIGNSDRSIKE